MAEMKKKESKSSRLYRNSPTAKRDEADGKVKVMRPSDEETQEDIDTAKEPDGEGVEPQHIEAIKDMHDRHSAEMHDMHKRHMKEVKKVYMKEKGDEKPDSMENVEKDKKD